MPRRLSFLGCFAFTCLGQVSVSRHEHGGKCICNHRQIAAAVLGSLRTGSPQGRGLPGAAFVLLRALWASRQHSAVANNPSMKHCRVPPRAIPSYDFAGAPPPPPVRGDTPRNAAAGKSQVPISRTLYFLCARSAPAVDAPWAQKLHFSEFTLK